MDQTVVESNCQFSITSASLPFWYFIGTTAVRVMLARNVKPLTQREVKCYELWEPIHVMVAACGVIGCPLTAL